MIHIRVQTPRLKAKKDYRFEDKKEARKFYEKLTVSDEPFKIWFYEDKQLRMYFENPNV